MTRRGTQSGTEPGQAGQPPFLLVAAVAGRVHPQLPSGGSGLPAAASASRPPEAPHRDLAGGGTGSAPAWPSEPWGLAARPALPVSRRPRGPAWHPARGAAVTARPRATGSPEHRESGEADRHPKPCPASGGSETRWPSQPHRLPAARPEVEGRGLCRDRCGRFKKKKFKAVKNFIGSSRRGQPRTQAD